jgi:hypothetical protein
MNWWSYWPYLVGPWQVVFIIGCFVYLTLFNPLNALWMRRQQHAWWLRISAKSLSELREIKWVGGLSEFQSRAIDWLIDFAERHPSESAPKTPPAEIVR